MYLPKHFEEPRLEVLHALMRARPLATVVTLTASGLNANHIPLLLLDEPAPYGTLRGHVARANPMGRDLVSDVETLVVFQGPDHYITPSWYATKHEDGKVVPTWNYAVVHACGTLRVVDDPAWLWAQMEALTDHSEAMFAEPWAVSDAPREYVEARMAATVGIELVITRLIGKWKTSQNQPARNQAGVVAGLRARGDNEAAEMAALVAARMDTERGLL
jgi:transcriptional regulator